MGKKTRKTRWRTLAINGHLSDSEESSTPTFFHQNNRSSYNKFYSSSFTYSSQSTPTRKYQNGSSKTTRSNSTTSEHKATFNEDEYTRITTPRQDVLFKKGYLNKPKNYQTQTSTSTSSTANSTSTCTPDHQSADGTEGTDLEYESQFVFPNGFIDQNGIYYINSYEPFPLLLYNAPLCYPEYPQERSKRYSTDSATDSISPHNEEVVQNGVAQPPEYYYNNASASDNSNEEPRKPKKKRRRKLSPTKTEGDTSCDTDSSDVVSEEAEQQETSTVEHVQEETPQPITNGNDSDGQSKNSDCDSQIPLQQVEETNSKYPLKPDAEEFIPRTFQVSPEIPYEPNNIQYVNFAPSYITVPYINHSPTFLPPGISINYVPIQEPKFVNVVVPSAPETKQLLEDHKVPDVATQTDSVIEQTPPKKERIDIATVVSKLEKTVVQKNKIECKNEWQQTIPRVQKKKGRFQYQNGFGPKPLERPKPQELIQNHIKNQTAPQNGICSKPNNYSGTARKSSQGITKPCSRYDKTLEPPIIKQRPTNQWISVASRKKKRKNGYEQQNGIEHIIDQDEQQKQEQCEDLFESFDVNLLEDVIPPARTQNEIKDCPARIENEMKEDPMTENDKRDNTKAIENEEKDSPIMQIEQKNDIPTIQIEQNSITTQIDQNCQATHAEQKKDDVTTQVENENKDNPPTLTENKEVDASVFEETVKKDDVLVETFAKPERDTKIIELEPKQLDVTIKNKEQRKKPKRTPQKLPIKRIIIKDDFQQEETKDEIPEEPKTEKPLVVNEPEAKTVENQPTSETLDKKKKKKKKVVKLQSISSSTTTLSNLDDSYDFLLENSIMEDSDQKTNIEMSRAFDLLIQKGMYNSLEEKIKALNISASDDGFFKSINFGTFKTHSAASKQIFAPLHFDKLYHNNFLKNEPDLKPSSSAIFLENPTVNEIIKNSDLTGDCNSTEDTHEKENPYPITQAVKNWLTKTRENTPEVELLKSPNTIYKELSEEPVEKGDDEVTLWSLSPQSSQEEDLLDCWENDLSVIKKEVNGFHNGQIEEGEDVVEIYDSKYGKNEDYFKLKAEVEEQQKIRNFPRHGNLPYRAICCNIM